MSKQSGKTHLAIIALLMSIAAVIGGILLLVTGIDAEGPGSPRAILGFVLVLGASIVGASANMMVLFSGKKNGKKRQPRYEDD